MPLSTTAVTLTPRSLPCRAVFLRVGRPAERLAESTLMAKTSDSRSPPFRSTPAASQSTTTGSSLSPSLLTTGSRCKPDSLDHADADRSLKNPSRVMRLPGTFHIDADGQSRRPKRHVHHHPTRTTALATSRRRCPRRKMHDKMVEASRCSDYKARSLDEIREALAKVPARVRPGTGTYHIYRNLFWGLIKACEEAGSNPR